MEVLTETYSEEEQRNYAGGFCGFVLLEETQYDLPALLVRLQKEWQITPLEAPPVPEVYTATACSPARQEDNSLT